MLPFVAAVTLAMKALCLAANSGLLRREERLPLASERGDPDAGGGGAGADPDTGVRPARRLRRAAEFGPATDSFGSIAQSAVGAAVNCCRQTWTHYQ